MSIRTRKTEVKYVMSKEDLKEVLIRAYEAGYGQAVSAMEELYIDDDIRDGDLEAVLEETEFEEEEN